MLTLIVKARELINGIPGNDELTVSTAEATVTIKDVNDEPPSFNRREYNIEIPENVPDGTPLPHLDMTVKDPDVVSVLVDFPPPLSKSLFIMHMIGKTVSFNSPIPRVCVCMCVYRTPSIIQCKCSYRRIEKSREIQYVVNAC